MARKGHAPTHLRTHRADIAIGPARHWNLSNPKTVNPFAKLDGSVVPDLPRRKQRRNRSRLGVRNSFHTTFWEQRSKRFIFSGMVG
jgi:hypothetical protein